MPTKGQRYSAPDSSVSFHFSHSVSVLYCIFTHTHTSWAREAISLTRHSLRTQRYASLAMFAREAEPAQELKKITVTLRSHVFLPSHLCVPLCWRLNLNVKIKMNRVCKQQECNLYNK